MNRPGRSIDDDLLIAALGLLALAVTLGCAVWIAAQAVLLLTEHRLLLEKSGSMLDIGPKLLTNPSAPERAFAPGDREQLPSGLWLYAAAAPVLAALGAAAAGAWQFASSLGGRNSSDGRWARRQDLKSVRVARAAGGRMVLGRSGRSLVATEQHHSVVVFGPTGSGKTTALVVPAILEHPGPVVALSVKSDLLRDTRRARAGQGPVYVYDPLGVTGEVCTPWTPLRACREWSEAQRMAEALTSALGDSGISDTRFWDAMASKMLEPMLHAAALQGLTMRDVVRWVDTRDKKLVTRILKHHKADLALQSWTASQTRDSRTLANVYASTEVLLRAYSAPGMADATAKESFSPDKLLELGGTLYVCAPTEDQARLRPIFAALVKDVYRCAILRAEEQGVLDPSLLLVLDEAANIAPVHDLAEIAATCRAYGIQLVTVFQDLAQVQARYRTKARTVVNNHTAKVLLPGASDAELLDMLEGLLGEETVEEVSRSHSESGASQTHSPRYRPLAAAHQLRQLKQGTGLLLYGNLPPIKLTLRPWFKDHALRRLAEKDAS